MPKGFENPVLYEVHSHEWRVTFAELWVLLANSPWARDQLTKRKTD